MKRAGAWFSGAAMLSLVACAGSDPVAESSSTQAGALGYYEFTLEPAAELAQGENLFRLTLRETGGTLPIEGAVIQVTTGMPSMGMDGPEVPAPVEIGDGTYELRDVVFSMGGAWEIICDAARGGVGDTAAFTYEVP